MKKILLSLALLATMATANAATFFYNGVLMGTVCRMGYYYTVYPTHMAQPVGTYCPVRNGYGQIIGTGTVTSE